MKPFPEILLTHEDELESVKKYTPEQTFQDQTQMVKLGVQCLRCQFSLNTSISSEAAMQNALPMALFKIFHFLQMALATFQDGLPTILSDNSYSANKEETTRQAEHILETVTSHYLFILNRFRRARTCSSNLWSEASASVCKLLRHISRQLAGRPSSSKERGEAVSIANPICHTYGKTCLSHSSSTQTNRQTSKAV